MELLKAAFLGLIQGLTEFLPISSSGHLVLFQKIFGIKEDALVFDIALHFATLIAVFIYFWKDIMEILKRPFSKLPLLIIVGTIPTGIIGILFSKYFKSLFESGYTLGYEFIFTGIVLYIAEKINSGKKDLRDMSYFDSTVIGTAQGIAILPAVSRSGMTLAGALLRGLNREFALKFSFLLSIPAILAAVAKDVPDMIKEGISLDPLFIIIGMIIAGISGYFTIKLMMDIFRRVSFKGFAIYVTILGALILIDQNITKIIF